MSVPPAALDIILRQMISSLGLLAPSQILNLCVGILFEVAVSSMSANRVRVHLKTSNKPFSIFIASYICPFFTILKIYMQWHSANTVVTFLKVDGKICRLERLDNAGTFSTRAWALL